MWPIQLAFLLFIVCRVFLSSLTLCNTRLVQLFYSILLQHHILKLTRYFWSIFPSTTFRRSLHSSSGTFETPYVCEVKIIRQWKKSKRILVLCQVLHCQEMYCYFHKCPRVSTMQCFAPNVALHWLNFQYIEIKYSANENKLDTGWGIYNATSLIDVKTATVITTLKHYAHFVSAV